MSWRANPPRRGPRILRRLGWLVATLIAVWLVLQFLPRRSAFPGVNRFRAPAGRALIIAHAGGLGLRPENTSGAFSNAVALGCDLLELDVRLTADGHLVTHHDATVDRTSDGSGLVLTQTLAELRRLDFAHHFTPPEDLPPRPAEQAQIATVSELFERYPDLPLVIEIKDRAEAGRRAGLALAGLIERFGRQQTVLVASFDDATLDAFRASSLGRVPTSSAKESTRTAVILNRLGLDWFVSAPEAALAIPVASGGMRLDRPGLIRAAHRRNQAVHYWTINDPAEMRRLIALGADGIITDRPDVLKQVLAELRR